MLTHALIERIVNLIQTTTQETKTMNIYAKMAAKYGEISFQGKSYALIEQAELTNRLFYGWWGDAKAGEEFLMELSAPAMDVDENEYVVTWQFEVIKGEEPDDASGYDWDVLSVIPA